ncbi:LysR substrate-binding domain-containing protein [Lentilactobacillus raoultii]|uniref:LysR substrate-binding domain-containing protein n=1 Tax=Lentilactobacillus raoultii TaxID=1987503 RepID=A0ABW3PFM3_9LACO|nr:LysR family transcriptional regulator [Lentilactobacillus raoultii]
MVTLKSLRTFIQLSEIGNYSKTAKKLHLSQPTVSVHIKSLEDELHTKLLKYDGSKYKPTEDGYFVLNYAYKISHLETDLRHAFENRNVKETNLRVAATSVGTILVPEIYDLVNEKLPNTYLMINISNSSKALASLTSADMDCVVAPLNDRQLNNYQKSYYVTVVAKDIVYFVANRSHPLAQKRKVGIADLQDQIFVMREEGSSTADMLSCFLRQNQIKAKNIIRVSQHETVYRTLSRGNGIGLLSKFWIPKNDANLKFLSISGFPVERNIYLISSKNNLQIKKFKEVLTSLFRNQRSLQN